MTFSCSGGIPADLFQKIVAGAGLDARVDAASYARLGGRPTTRSRSAFPRANT